MGLKTRKNDSWIGRSTSSRPTAEWCGKPCVSQDWDGSGLPRILETKKSLLNDHILFVFGLQYNIYFQLSPAFTLLFARQKSSCLCPRPDLWNKQILAVAWEASPGIHTFPAWSCTEQLEKSDGDYPRASPHPSERAPAPDRVALHKGLLWSKTRHIGSA